MEFPATSWDLLADAAGHGDRAAGALNEFAERYYAAVRAFIAAVARGSAAEDLTQRFFETVILSGRLLTNADRAKGHFRPYLKQAIRNFLVDEKRRDARTIHPDVRPDLVADGWNVIAADSAPGPDAAMLQAWARSLVAMAVTRLEAVCAEKGQREHFELFSRRYLRHEPQPSWREVGEPFGLEEKVARSRTETAARHFRVLLRSLISSDIGSEDDVDRELQSVIALL